MNDQSLSCTTRNLSAGGAALILPFNTGLFDIYSVRGLDISDISYFGVELVWTSNNQCGVKFLGSAVAMRKMAVYLDQYIENKA